MRGDQQECQQQMMEILEKVSGLVKKVENICMWVNASTGGRILYSSCEPHESEYHPGKLSAPLNLLIFLGQEPVPSTEGSID